MEKFDLKSMKFLIAVVAVCIIFVAFLPMAYKSLPSNDVNNSVPESEVIANNDKTSESEAKQVEVANDNQSELSDRAGKKNVKIVEDDDNIELKSPAQQKIEELPEAEDLFEKAMSLRKEQKYESAVYEYQEIAKSSDDLEIKSQCYQEIALIYASIKRYGSALSYAQKAYNTSPNSDREMIMARLYYKTGNIDKATNHVNAILKRDFVDE